MKKAGIDKLLKAHGDIGAITTEEVETLEEANEVVDIFRDYVSAETSHGMRVSIPKVDIYYGFDTIMML